MADWENQDGVNLCVTGHMQLLIFDPWVTVEEILNYLSRIGPEGSVSRLMHMLGGRAIFQQTLEKMEIIRQARIQGTMSAIAKDTKPCKGTIPEIDPRDRWQHPLVGAAGVRGRTPLSVRATRGVRAVGAAASVPA